LLRYWKNSWPTTGVFLFLICILYTTLVNIMSLSGTRHKKEPSWEKGSRWDLVSALCSFLYIVDMTKFTRYPNGRRMDKKCIFYTYACTVKYSLYGSNMLLYFCTCILIVKSHLSCKYWVAFYFVADKIHYGDWLF